jgi:hypothetical protein
MSIYKNINSTLIKRTDYSKDQNPIGQGNFIKCMIFLLFRYLKFVWMCSYQMERKEKKLEKGTVQLI